MNKNTMKLTKAVE